MSSAPYVSHQPTIRRTPWGQHAPALWAAIVVILGFLVAVLAFVAVLMWTDAHDAENAANRAAASAAGQSATPAGADTDTHAHATAAGLDSYAGAAPANADALAEAHRPFPAAMPAIPAGPVADVDLVLKDVTVQIAPGILPPGPGPVGLRARSSTCGRASWSRSP